MKKRAEIDELVWRTIEETPPQAGSPPGYDVSGRPANFRELFVMTMETEDFERSWSEFLHEFYRFKRPSFFETEPPPSFRPKHRALARGRR